MSTNLQVTVTDASFEELNSVLDLIDQFDREKAVRPNEITLRETYQRITDVGGAVVVAKVHERIVATCTLNICANLSWSARPYAMIENVIVDQEYRQQGLGKAVLNYAVKKAQVVGCYKVALMTGSKRPQTLAFYESAGFEQSKTGFQIRF